MRTNIVIDDKLMDDALKITGYKTKKEAVTAALEEYVQYQEQLKILELRGQIDFDPDYDHKKIRSGNWQ